MTKKIFIFNPKRIHLKEIILAVVLFLFPSSSFAEIITLHVPSYNDGSHLYYHDLLKSSLKAAGHQATLVFPVQDLPQKRALRMLEEGTLSLSWMLETKERNKKYTPVKVGITNNLIGHRILFIPKNSQSTYTSVKSLDDFRKTNKIGGFGENWFDITVWEQNKLPYFIQSGDWRSLFLMVAAKDRGVDYISRGINEIVIEANLYPYLDIEQQLLLKYNRDFLFYLSRTGVKYHNIIEDALLKARQTGLMSQMIDKYWGDLIKKINFDQRIEITLETPK